MKMFYSLNRHGTRLPGQDEIEDMASILPSLRDKIVTNIRKGAIIESLRRLFCGPLNYILEIILIALN